MAGGLTSPIGRAAVGASPTAGSSAGSRLYWFQRSAVTWPWRWLFALTLVTSGGVPGAESLCSVFDIAPLLRRRAKRFLKSSICERMSVMPREVDRARRGATLDCPHEDATS